LKTYNTKYKDNNQLREFIKLNNIIDSKKILLQVFTGICDKLYIEKLIYEIKELLPSINIIGSTTDGEIIDGEATKLSTILSFTIFDNSDITILQSTTNISSFQAAKSIIKQFNNIDDIKLAIIFTDGLNTNGEGFLKAFNKFAPDITVAGGLAGDNATFKKTFIFTQHGICNELAICAILSSNSLVVNNSYSFGWETIGKELTVTKSIENIVYEIDGQSPIAIYKKYLGDDIGDKLPSTGIEFPLIITTKEGRKIARAVVGKNEDGSLVFAGNIATGQKVHLAYGNIDNIFHDSNRCYNELIKKPIESIFIYSCMARKRLLGDTIKNELIPISKIAPMSGFFTYGEFFYFSNTNIETKNKLFNETMTLVTLSETSNIKQIDTIENEFSSTTNTTIKALSNLIKETTQELQELNNSLETKVKNEVMKNLEKDQQLFEQSRLAQMGEMIGNIAHQWRQPLSAISSIASGVQLSNELDLLSKEEISQNMSVITEKTAYLSDTINTFRDFLKDDKIKKEVILQDKIDKALNIVYSTIRDNNIEIINNIPYDMPINLTIITGELPQVIINIINNAKDILIEKDIEDKWIKLDLITKEKSIIISIEDNGGGIPAKYLTKIFEPYFTTKHKSQGTGLGLHMSYKIMTKSLGGNLTAKNSENGAIFYIELPIS